MLNRKANTNLAISLPHAKVERCIAAYEPGQIKLNGIYWTARLESNDSFVILHVGQVVEVIEREGNTLTVRPLCCPVRR